MEDKFGVMAHLFDENEALKKDNKYLTEQNKKLIKAIDIVMVREKNRKEYMRVYMGKRRAAVISP